MKLLLVFSSLILCHTAQAMEQDVEFYNEKHEMSFLMQAIQKKEPGKLEKMVVEEKKVVVEAIHDYMCQRHGCRFSTTHEIRINRHREMHRRKDALPHLTLYHCKTCDYLTDTQKSLNDHNNSHSNEKLYYCDICDVGFKSIGSRNRHENTKHKKQIPAKPTLVRPLLVTNNG